MLKQRILTALILAPLAIAGIFFLPPLGFAIFIAIVLIIGAWEWANLAGFNGLSRYVYAACIAILLIATHIIPAKIVLLLGAVWWLTAFILVVKYPSLKEYWAKQWVISCIGVFSLVPGFTALLVLKQSNDSSFLILLLFFLIWGADIGAYFSGRALGNKKLAPEVSPGKSWEGFIGGAIAALIIAIGMLYWLDKSDLSFTRTVVFLIGCTVVVMISVLGDLTESMFKRNRGIKDSSNLLPGHGGILDRVDSLLSAGPIFALLIIAFGWT